MMKTSKQRESYTVLFSVRILALNRTCVSSFITCNFVLMWILFAVISFFPFSFKLPAMFVVTAIMQKFAAVSKSTETSFLVIFTYIWLIIPTNCCTQICWRPDRPLSERKKCSKDMNSSSYVSKLKLLFLK